MLVLSYHSYFLCEPFNVENVFFSFSETCLLRGNIAGTVNIDILDPICTYISLKIASKYTGRFLSVTLCGASLYTGTYILALLESIRQRVSLVRDVMEIAII